MKSGEIWEYNQGNLVVKLKDKTEAFNELSELIMECWTIDVLETSGIICDFGSGINIIPRMSLVEFFSKRYDEEES